MRLLAFIGALGSRRTQRDRVERLRAAWISAQAIQRVQSPLGLDLDAQSLEETAVSISAHFIAKKRGASGRRWREMSGPIHRQPLSVG
ncbi:hypothetical protein CH304_19335 [Rhodococcus sp. 15-649-1-2]|nr:XdhC family protein [Rhodococcus sp. 15-649-1-2]OZE79133.1 hypothetical protein CH304_19335 [Rhodococcus sp. 15-649-1-2]